MRYILLYIYFLPIFMLGQKKIHLTDREGYLAVDKIVGVDTFFVYPYFFDNMYYQSIDSDSLPDGLYNGYLNDSMTLLVQVRYKNLRPDGTVYYYNKNGSLKSTYTYKNGFENGPYKHYNEAGLVTEMGEYKNGKTHGGLFEYWDNGKIKKISHSNMGTLTGSYKYYYENGQINIDGRYVTLEESSVYATGYHVGTWNFYYKDGQLQEVRHYIDSIGSKERQYIIEYEKSKRAQTDFPIGTWFMYDSKGNKISENTYQNFQLEKSIKYYSNGKIKEITNYSDFHQGYCSQNPSYYIKGGPYSEFYESGNKKTEGSYLDNEKEGQWMYWTDTGQLTKKEIYKRGKLMQ